MKIRGLTFREWGFWGVVDNLGHELRLPHFIQRRICDRFDRSLEADGTWEYDPPTPSEVKRYQKGDIK